MEKAMLTYYKPRLEELRFRERLLADGETMAYNRAWGGTIPFPAACWADWYKRWVEADAGQRWYRYLCDSGAKAFVGEIAYHYDAELPGYLANVIVFSAYRGRGYGSRGLELLCAAAKENGVDVLYDDIASDNPAAAMFLRHGFAEERRTGDRIILRRVL